MEETTDLLQQLIKNQCVNDGTPASGHEIRSADTLASYLQAPGVEIKRYEPQPGRGSLVLRIEGNDPSAFAPFHGAHRCRPGQRARAGATTVRRRGHRR